MRFSFPKWYRSKSIKWPYVMAFSTCLLKGSISDSFTQTKLEQNEQFDFKRNSRFAIWSASYCGCVQHFLYNVLYPRMFPSVGWIATICAVAVDTGLHGPLCYLPVYYMSKSVMTGGTVKNGWQEYFENKWSILTAYWKVWTPTVIVMMRWIPPELRVLTLSGVSLFWLVLLSYIAPMTDRTPQDESQDESQDLESV
mmetsp:Transcript_5969/g.9508  ORF Transcript_5969/g.9508 Transcript_5969/m.9508 type:complete len:197 (-) Transcript_5969:23-613(-)